MWKRKGSRRTQNWSIHESKRSRCHRCYSRDVNSVFSLESIWTCAVATAFVPALVLCSDSNLSPCPSRSERTHVAIRRTFRLTILIANGQRQRPAFDVIATIIINHYRLNISIGRLSSQLNHFLIHSQQRSSNHQQYESCFESTIQRLISVLIRNRVLRIISDTVVSRIVHDIDRTTDNSRYHIISGIVYGIIIVVSLSAIESFDSPAISIARPITVVISLSANRYSYLISDMSSSSNYPRYKLVFLSSTLSDYQDTNYHRFHRVSVVTQRDHSA